MWCPLLLLLLNRQSFILLVQRLHRRLKNKTENIYYLLCSITQKIDTDYFEPLTAHCRSANSMICIAVSANEKYKSKYYVPKWSIQKVSFDILEQKVVNSSMQYQIFILLYSNFEEKMAQIYFQEAWKTDFGSLSNWPFLLTNCEIRRPEGLRTTIKLPLRSVGWSSRSKE